MEPFIALGLIILIVFFTSVLMRILRQPLIVGYILAGVITGPLFLNVVTENETILTFSEIGVAFLLFTVGIHLSPRVIKEVGGTAVVTGIGQIVFTALIGFSIAQVFGFDWITSLYIALALSFSSTIIIMKLLTDKEALDKLYGKISIGFLLVQDLVAIIILIVISSLTSGAEAQSLIIGTILKGTLLAVILFPVSYYILPRLNHYFARSQEFLFVFAITWGLGLASLFFYLGFSIEVGALIAGVALSISPYAKEIGSRLKPLRDFFIISFFLILGSQMTFTNISTFIVPIVVLSLFVLIGNPLIVMTLMGISGHHRKVGFMSGLTVAQISEFSLILIALGVRVGHLSKDILSFITLIALITIAGSTYMILYSDTIYEKISNMLTIFERKKAYKKETVKKQYKYILLGYNRVGYSILRAFSKMTHNFLVVDYNPEVIRELKKEGINCVYGDVEDVEFLDDMGIQKAELIVSTIPEKETNALILGHIKRRNNKKPIIIVTAREIAEALSLYKEGADYVILPHFLGGEHIARLIQKGKAKKKFYEGEKSQEIKDLLKRIEKGHEHPRVTRN